MSSLIHQVIRSAYLSRELCVAVMPRGAGHALHRPGRLVTPGPTINLRTESATKQTQYARRPGNLVARHRLASSTIGRPNPNTGDAGAS